MKSPTTTTTTKVCTKCLRRKAKAAFKPKLGGKDGLNAECTACRNARAAAWRKKNPDKNAAINARAYVRTKRLRRAARLAAKKAVAK
jgi:hypothetical protein